MKKLKELFNLQKYYQVVYESRHYGWNNLQDGEDPTCVYVDIHKIVIDIHPKKFQKRLNKKTGKIVGDKSREEYRLTSYMPITKERYYKLLNGEN